MMNSIEPNFKQLKPPKVLPDPIQLLYYKSKNQDLLSKYKNYKLAKNVIEIVPFDSEQFDIISYIDFANATETHGFKKISHSSKTHIFLYKCIKSNEGDVEEIESLYSFHIIIDECFRSIKVYIKHNLTQFTYAQKDNNECIVLSIYESNPMNIYGLKPNCKKNSLIFQTGKYFANLNVKCPDWLRQVFINYQSEPTRIKKKKIGQTNDIIKMLTYFPGYTLLTLQPQDPVAFSVDLNLCSLSHPNIKVNPDLMNDIKLRKSYTLQSIVTLFPWAQQILNECDFIEMDASFRGSKPYCFCVANCIFK